MWRAPNCPTIALRGGLYLAIKMDHYGRPYTTPTIALLGGFCLAIIMERYQGPILPLL
jgi:hypothetical protein